jgi:hypothetical protein
VCSLRHSIQFAPTLIAQRLVGLFSRAPAFAQLFAPEATEDLFTVADASVSFATVLESDARVRCVEFLAGKFAIAVHLAASAISGAQHG